MPRFILFNLFNFVFSILIIYLFILIFFIDAVIGRFCETLEDLCGRAEIFSDDRDEAEWIPLTVSDLKMVINDIVSIRTKKILHLIPVDILSRLLRVLDHQIHRAEGLSIDDCDHVSSCRLRLFFFNLLFFYKLLL